MPTMTKPVSPTLEPASAGDDTSKVFEQDDFELDIRIIVPHELRPMVAIGYATAAIRTYCVVSCQYSCPP
jgi:hypothetical protein